jgi:hypothetical protein
MEGVPEPGKQEETAFGVSNWCVADLRGTVRGRVCVVMALLGFSTVFVKAREGTFFSVIAGLCGLANEHCLQYIVLLILCAWSDVSLHTVSRSCEEYKYLAAWESTLYQGRIKSQSIKKLNWPC